MNAGTDEEKGKLIMDIVQFFVEGEVSLRVIVLGSRPQNSIDDLHSTRYLTRV